MGFRFRKSIKIAPGVKLNFNKKSTGVTFGGKGFHYTVNSNGKRTSSVGIPGTGLYYTSSSGGNSGSGSGGSGGGNNYGNNYAAPSGGPGHEPPKKNYNLITILLLIFFFPAGLYFMWAKTSWNKVVKIIISAFWGLMLLIGVAGAIQDSNLPASSSGIQSIEIEEDTVRLDRDDVLNMSKTINVHYSQNYSVDILNSDFVFVYSDDSIAKCDVQFLTDSSITVRVTGYAPGTTTMHIETTDGTIKSNEITIEVLGRPAAAETTTQETTTEATTTETTIKETTTEATTKDTSRTVYITPSGSKYHYSKSCAGDNAIERTLNEVKDAYEPCKKCAQ